MHLFRDIVNSDEDVETVLGSRKGSHEVNPLYVKQFHLKNATLRHLVPLGKFSHSLTSITSHEKFFGTFEESGPIETYMEYLYNSLVRSKASTIS